MEHLQFKLPVPEPPQRRQQMTQGSLTSAVTYAVDKEIEAVMDACERGVVWVPDDGTPAESIRVPSAQERQLLDLRRQELSVMARGCAGTDAEKRKAAVAIAEMLDGFTRSRNLDGKAKQAMIAGLVIDLQALPSWAIVRACERAKRGEITDMDLAFMPTTAQLYKAAMAEMAPLRVEERRIAAALAFLPRGGVVTDEEIARRRTVAEAWLKRSDPRAQNLDASRNFVGTESSEEDRLRRQRFNEQSMLGEYARLGIEPVYACGTLVSPSLLKTIGRLPQAQKQSGGV